LGVKALRTDDLLGLDQLRDGDDLDVSDCIEVGEGVFGELVADGDGGEDGFGGGGGKFEGL
jgi:hypothetical protein